MTKRIAQIEVSTPSTALQAIYNYFDGSGYSLSQVLAILEKDKRFDFKVGRGANHVWVSDVNNQRMLIIT